MPLFFFISGLLYNPQKDPSAKIMLRRTWRSIGVPFLFFTALGAVICVFTGRLMQPSIMDWLRALATFEHGDPYVGGSLWFLTCLANARMLFWCWLMWKAKGHTIIGNTTFLAILFTMGIVFGELIHPKVLMIGPLMFFSVPMALFFYALGYFSTNAVVTVIDTLGKVSTTFLSAILFCGTAILSTWVPTPNMAIPTFPSPLTFLPAACCGILATILLSRAMVGCKALQFIGKNSLYYFLLERWAHCAWIAICIKYMPKMLDLNQFENTNIMNLSVLQVTAFFAFTLTFGTVLLSPVRKTLDWFKKRLAS